VEINGARSARITSAYHETPRMDPNPPDDARRQASIESINPASGTRIHEYLAFQVNLPIEERVACEVTMSYASRIEAAPQTVDRNEIIVIQQYSTGDTSLLYRGYLMPDGTYQCQGEYEIGHYHRHF
jgi:hypothetical protein